MHGYTRTDDNLYQCVTCYGYFDTEDGARHHSAVQRSNGDFLLALLRDPQRIPTYMYRGELHDDNGTLVLQVPYIAGSRGRQKRIKAVYSKIAAMFCARCERRLESEEEVICRFCYEVVGDWLADWRRLLNVGYDD